MSLTLFAVFAVNCSVGSVRRSRISREGMLGVALLTLLSGCAGMPGSKALQDSLSADPSLQTPPPIAKTVAPAPTPAPTPTPTPTPTPASQIPNPATPAVLPDNFPSALPQYPDATLTEVILPEPIAADTSERLKTPTTPEAISPSPRATAEAISEPFQPSEPSETSTEPYPWQTRWKTTDPIDTVRNFYKRELKRQAWTTEQVMLSQTDASFTVRREAVSAIVRITAGAAGQPTEIAIDYAIKATIASGTNTEVNTPGTQAQPDRPQPSGVTRFSDLSNPEAIAEPLRSSLAEVVKLGVLTPKTGDRFAPNEPATRREYVRWLFAAHNRIYADRPAEQLRAIAPESSGSIAFQDVPKSDSDFAIIQGLAEAGILPSALNGNDTTTQFQPNDPLTRETLVGWKVPLDRRRSLPTATIDALQNTWGFQDTEQIAPLALRALLVDFQNGDLSVVRRTFGYTTLFQPKKVVTRAEAAVSLWYFGFQGEGRSAKTAVTVGN